MDAPFEVVVAENSDDGGAVEDLRREFAGDSRVRACRTGGLELEENWEAALSEAAGEYLLLISDKCVLLRSALAVSLAACEEHGSLLSSGWLTHLMGSRPPLRLQIQLGSGVRRVVRSRDVAAAFARDPLSLSELGLWLPLCYTALFHRSLAEAARHGPTGALFMPIGPDVTSAYQFLALVDSYVLIDEPLAIYRGGEPGIAVSFFRDDAAGQALEARVPKAAVRSDAQFPFPYRTLVNFLLRDYHLIQHFYPERLPPLDLFLPGYFAAVISHAQTLHAFGVDAREHVQRVQRALADMSPAERTDIHAYCRRIGLAGCLDGLDAVQPMGTTVAFESLEEVLDWKEHGGEYLRRREQRIRELTTACREKERTIQTLARACDEKAREIESLGRVAAERLALLERLHAEAARLGEEGAARCGPS